jgi:hypothetical protein
MSNNLFHFVMKGLQKFGFCIRRQIVYVMQKENLPDIVSRSDINVSKITLDNVIDGASMRTKSHIQKFECMIHDGQIGLYGYDVNGNVVCHVWAIPYINSALVKGYFKLSDKTALIHYCRVIEEMRGRGVYRYMLLKLYQELFSNETEKIYIDTEIDNFAAQKAITATGALYLFNLFTLSFRGRLLFSKEKRI